MYPEFYEALEEWWGKEVKGNKRFIVHKKLQDIHKQARIWNKKVMGNLFAAKTKIEEDLAKAEQDLIASSFFDSCKQVEKDKLENLSRILRMEEIFSLQKSRVRWLKEGDNNKKKNSLI